jgi:tetratricopeptide (TPR) repeat protein
MDAGIKDAARAQAESTASVASAVPEDPNTPNIPARIIRTQALAQEQSPPDTTFPPTNLLSHMTDPNRDAPYIRRQLDDALTRKLWESRVSAPDPNEDVETRATLAQLIRQIQSVKFEVKEQHPAFSIPAESEPINEPNGIESAPERRPEQITAPYAEASVKPGGDLPGKMPEKIKHVVQDPNQVRRPLETAELLFLSNRPAEAAILYQKALDLMDTEEITAQPDRAWVLFQLGNCLRETDMIRAQGMYKKLIAEYPDSPWTELAKAHDRLITWYETAKPRRLMTGQTP